MKKIILFLTLSLFFIVQSSVAQNQESSLGDTISSFNAGVLTPTPDRILQGVEYAQRHFWVTGSDPDDNFNQKLYKFSRDEQNLVEYWEIDPGATTLKDLAYDGEFLYAAGVDTIYQINPANGQLTGVTIPGPEYYLNGLAYDPEHNHFWVSGDGNLIYEIDFAGNVIKTVSFPQDLPTAGMAWDTVTAAGPYLWVWSMKYTSDDVRPKAYQIAPSTGELTGVTFEGVLMHPSGSEGADYAGGAAITTEYIANKTTLIGIHGSSFQDSYDQLDWIVTYDLDPLGSGIPGPEISVNPQSIENNVMPGDSVDIPITVSNNSDSYQLNWQTGLEYPFTDTSASPGDSLLSFNATEITPDNNDRLKGIAFAGNHLFISSQTNFDDQFKLYKIKKDGSEIINTYTLGSLYQGWTTITSDGAYIYGAQQYQINKFDPDSGYIVDSYPRPNFSPSGMAYDPQQEHFFLGGGNGAIMKINKEGDELNFYTTPYDIAGLSWDNWSPGGPFLWVYYYDEENATIRAKRINPDTGGDTGASFEGINLSDAPSLADEPLDIAVTPNWQENKLVMTALHDSYDEANGNSDEVIVYDMAITPAPGWIELLPQSYGNTAPQGEDVFTVRLKAIMEDTLMSAQIVITSNDVLQPKTIIPVNFRMMPALPTSVEKYNSKTNARITNVYPNPARDIVNIQLRDDSNPAIVRIYSLSGKRVFEKEYSKGGAHIIGIGNLTGGIYYISVETNSKRETKKLVIY